MAQPLYKDDFPQFSDAASCKRWVDALPLTNVPLVQQMLTQQLALVIHAGLPASELLRILETLQAAVAYAQQELATQYIGKALPLDRSEHDAWQRAITLWREMFDGYLTCCEALARGDATLRAHSALIITRCLHYTTQLIIEHYRIRHQPPTALWQQLHRLYAFAEKNGDTRDPASDDIADVCTTAFVRALLVQLSNPFAMTPRQFDLVVQWLALWAPLVRVRVTPPTSAMPTLVVDLTGTTGAVPAQNMSANAGLRYLETDALGHALHHMLAALKQNKTPAELGLGHGAHVAECKNLLMAMYIQWCRAGGNRAEERADSNEAAHICLGLHPAHFFITGRVFRAPDRPLKLTKEEEREIEVFGHVSARSQLALASIGSTAHESWAIVNHNHAGLMCMRRETQTTNTRKTRIHHQQLIAVQPPRQPAFQVGMIQWLRVEENEQLFVGVRLFPGVAEGVAARPLNFTLPAVKSFERALLIPETATTPTTLILPNGWYQADRTVELYIHEAKQTAKLVSLIEKGSDFERCVVALS